MADAPSRPGPGGAARMLIFDRKVAIISASTDNRTLTGPVARPPERHDPGVRLRPGRPMRGGTR